MKKLTTGDLTRYILRQADTYLSHEVERQAAGDSELAAKLRLMARSVGVTLPNEVQTIATRSRSRSWLRPRPLPRWLRRAAVILAAVCLGSGLACATISLLATPPLLEDHFETSWGDVRKWETPRRAVKVEDGHVRLLNRGYLVTAGEYPGPIELRFRWHWIDLVGDFLYRDELTVALRTSGVPSDKRAYEITDGVLVKLNATGGIVVLMAADSDVSYTETARGSVPLPAEQWHKVRITDDGDVIAVYVTGPKADKEAQTPVVTAKIPPRFSKRRIAFYNRECVADANHESWIDDVVIRRLKIPGGPPTP